MIVLLRAGVKRQIRQIAALILLFTMMTLSLVMAIQIAENSKQYIAQEMERLGFGDTTLWLSFSAQEQNQLLQEIQTEAENLKEVEKASTQQLIFSGYSTGEQRSDDEGQLILYEPEQVPYRFFTQQVSGYQKIEQIEEGTIYVSPAMAANFQVQIGDTITFRLSRNGETQSFQIAGYFEDPFMGSSMIDRKGFLIGEIDFANLQIRLQQTDSFQKLARIGAMLHITKSKESTLSEAELSGLVMNRTSAGALTEFSYSKESIEGFMMILQNIMTGFLVAFAGITGLICMLIVAHSISASIEQEYKDIGILKTIGCKSGFLRWIQTLQYLFGVVIGIGLGCFGAALLGDVLTKQMIWSTGLQIPNTMFWGKIITLLLLLVVFFIGLIYRKTKLVMNVSPMQAISGRVEKKETQKVVGTINGKYLYSSFALRQIRSNRKKYASVAIVAALLTFLVVIVAVMNQWLGPQGEGLMNSFSVAEHDLGVQPNHQMELTEVEQLIASYTNIQDTYELAMQSGTIQERELTINVLDDPKWFHIIDGRTCTTEDEMLLTEYVASDLGVTIGDELLVQASAGEEVYRIVGIYACANEMGANVGMTKEGYAKIGNIQDPIWCRHYILATSSYNTEIMQLLQSRYPMDLDVHTNSWSGLDSIVSTMKWLTALMYGIVGIIVLVVVCLTSGKLLQIEQRDIAILKNQGFQVQKLRYSFALRFGITSFLGVLIGVIVSLLFGNRIIESMLKPFGISDFSTSFSLIQYVGLPLLVIVLFFLAAYGYSGKIKKSILLLTTSLCISVTTGCGANVESTPVKNTQQVTETETMQTKEVQTYSFTQEKQTIKDGFSYVAYEGDDQFEAFLRQQGASSDTEVVQFLATHLFADASQLRFAEEAFGCSSVAVQNAKGEHIFGRNFDWNTCEALVVKSEPTQGYTSIATVNMDFIKQGAGIGSHFLPEESMTLASLYAPLDGMNEAGFAISVNMISDGDTIEQNTDKPDLTTTTAVRLLLNHAANVEEAIALLDSYDLHSSMGMMVHFAMTDFTGNSVVVEYIDNEMKVTQTPVVTNFYLTPGTKYGIGTEQSKQRYQILMDRIENQTLEANEVKEALDSVSKDNFHDTATTEWSIVFELEEKTATYYHREDYTQGYRFLLTE